MAPLLNPPVAQLRRLIELLNPRRLFPPQPIRRRHFKYVFAVFAVVAIVDGVGEQNTAPPTEELSGTPTVDKASAWWWSAQRAQDSGAACTGSACPPKDDDSKSAVKRQFIGSKFPVGWMAGQHGLSSTPPPPASTTTSMKPQINATLTNGTHVNGTPTGEIPLVTNVGESGGEARGVGAWNSCAASAVLLGLVAVGVVVLL
ncbi:hypothetical protein VF21_04823 [Pseudogymnoascus sp. 05NY08]|nr:hypothetical protein VF21_04823 [Pseudogymnoascus sp. 05NY08]